MTTTPVTLIKGDETSADTDYRDALPVNMYAVERNVLGVQGYLYASPGLSTHGTGVGADRGATYSVFNNFHYRLSGTSLINVFDSGNTSFRGTIAGTGQALMRDIASPVYQGIVVENQFWLAATGGPPFRVTNTHVGLPIDGVWIDGYFILTDGASIYHTELTDPTSIDPLAFSRADFAEDPITGLGKTKDNKLIVFGRFSVEYFVNVAAENFVFQRISARTQKIGIVSPFAKCELAGVIYLMGGRRFESTGIHALGAGNSEKISTREIDILLSAYGERDEALLTARMEVREERDVALVLIHLPDMTLCYNATIASKFGKSVAWSILQTNNGAYRAINGVFDAQNSRWVYGDKLGGNIGFIDHTTFAHYDVAQTMELTSPFLKLERQSIDEIELETISGRTSVAGATVSVSLTTDGSSYSPEVSQSYGEPGETDSRLVYRRIGYVDNWIGFRFRAVTKSRMAFSVMVVEHG